MNRNSRLKKTHKMSISDEERKNFDAWYIVVKRELLRTEPQNILARAKCFTDIINESCDVLISELKLPKITKNLKYVSNINPLNHLNFLTTWCGLRIENTDRVPKTRKEYEKKSKNWLNGRRAPNYGKTLFPMFIFESEKYAVKLSKVLIPNNDKKRGLLCDIIVYKVLSKLCGCSVSLHEQAKKAPFFCKNSVERKCKLRSLLQDYAKEHKYVQGFPSCFEEAVGYFNKKLRELIGTYQHVFNNENNNNNNNNNNNVNNNNDDHKININNNDDGNCEYYNGDTVQGVGQIYKSIVRSQNLMKNFDCTSIVTQHLWNSINEEIYVDNCVDKIKKLLPNNKILQKLCSEDDCYLSVFFSDEKENCVAAPLPDNETITLKDVFTQEQPRLVLLYIQQIVLHLGGTANVNFKNANLEANLATHNFPAPVTIGVRMYYYQKYSCHLVKFERIGGDTLHFARVLRKLVQKCGPVLTGLPDEQFNPTPVERELASKLPNFGAGIKPQY